MWWILAFLIVVVLVYLWMQPSGFTVERREVIPALRDAVIPLIQDLKRWPEWSPWLMHEPGCALQYSSETDTAGSWYSWEGQYIGAGRVEHVALELPDSLAQRIVFLKPMKSTSQILWQFREVDGGTEVLWRMQGKMPFFLRPLNRKMDGWIGQDFELGLARLAMVASPEAAQFEIHFEGDTDLPARQCLSLPFEGVLADLPQIYDEGFPRLKAAIDNADLDITGPPLSVYHDIKPKTGFVRGEMAIPVRVSQAVSGFKEMNLPARRYFRTRLQGDYPSIRHGWYAAYSHVGMLKIKVTRREPVVEVYANDPMTNQGTDLITYLDIPLKS